MQVYLVTVQVAVQAYTGYNVDVSILIVFQVWNIEIVLFGLNK